MCAGPKSGEDEPKARDASIDAGALEELRQPLASATNYIGAARLLIAPIDTENCRNAIEQLTQAEKQLLCAGRLIGKLRSPSNGPREA